GELCSIINCTVLQRVESLDLMSHYKHTPNTHTHTHTHTHTPTHTQTPNTHTHPHTLSLFRTKTENVNTQIFFSAHTDTGSLITRTPIFVFTRQCPTHCIAVHIHTMQKKALFLSLHHSWR